MRLTPEQIVGYPFKKAMRGYEVAEVDELLDRLADQIEELEAELAAERRRAADVESRMAAALETEATLKRTLVTAQQVAERSIDDARTHADELVASARAEAERLRAEAQEEAERTTANAQALARREVEAARARVRDAAERHAELIQHVATHRDQLRGHLVALEELVIEPPPEVTEDLVIGEVSRPPTSERARPEDPDEPPGDPGGLTVRVHGPGDPSSGSPPLGSGNDEGN